ncbi:2-hydroxymuconate tautomerase family protein [Candidatus Trichorickettsia mobilis]|uniref:2-hydroxymuconate tautomerase family protein n=1 Tax=Candidatus Trichorickettsia mobilis TaxID=1346319 RepID=UPI002930CDA5|nr:2-hydroxymuconate tautomerase family protein [Candidatus Trichorickettsia mobilis]
MPIVHIHLHHGRSNEKKRMLVEKVTNAICESVDVTPERVQIILHDVMPENYGKAGVLGLDAAKIEKKN